ncbi:Outer membrane protein assembly factor BamB, contains PQQ-like beta-propeller repeat [Halomicrobium zhouii]|uniref:Outer membrane protein assembly factor BamB, contains PQQ-like beta-propeller repeat n=1 Tax=Halomicrobium zhouii TaxID=767519 RepID=A0A1I6KSU7_9EURY|nr:PQQ-binding-like beta-propeller repeat protein [Halomicrobium zhouii]SFR94286.1 Outer membrane protein assembly factor BamB, contains PQQ-like beta-propeller repeat [Halomicrobium zhouii]
MPSRRAFLSGVGAVTITATAGCLDGATPYYAGQDDPDTSWWPQPTFDRYGTCYNPQSVGPTDGVSERWSVEISSPSARPVVADGTALLPTADGVVAVSAATGDEQWRERGDDDDPVLWPRDVLVHDGTVYVAVIGETGIYALDLETGERRWTFSEPDHGVQTLLIEPRDGYPMLFAGAHDTVYGLDPETGERRWRREVFGEVMGLVLGIPELLVATQGGELYALSRDDGKGYWRRNFHGMCTALGTTTWGGPYVSFFGGPTYRLDDYGKIEWRADSYTRGSFVLTGDTIFTAGHRLQARKSSGGDERWTAGETTDCGPAAAGETVYAASDTAVTAYRFDGGTGVGPLRTSAKRWSHEVEGRPAKGIAVADGAVFVLTEGGNETSSMAYALESA